MGQGCEPKESFDSAQDGGEPKPEPFDKASTSTEASVDRQGREDKCKGCGKPADECSCE